MGQKTIEKLYSTIIQTSMDSFWMVDIHGHFLDVNDAYCKLIGYSRADLLKMHISDVEALENPEDTATHMHKIMEDGFDHFETRHRCCNGAMVDLEVSVNYTDAEGGRLFAFLRDITARKIEQEELKLYRNNLKELVNIRTEALKKANDELCSTDQRFRRLTEASIIGIITADMQSITSANDKFLAMIGYSREDLEVGRIDWQRMTPPEFLTHAQSGLAQLERQGWCEPFEKEYVRKDGSRIPVLLGASVLTQKPLTWICFVLDLTKRKQAEKELRDEITVRINAEEALAKSERWLRLMTDSLPVLISYVNRQQKYVFNNKEYEKWFGISYEEIKGRHIREILGEKHYNDTLNYLEGAFLGREVTYERAMTYKDGQEHFLRVSYVPDIRERGEVEGIFVLGADITERVKAERLLRLHVKQLADLEETQKKTLARELHDQVGPNLTALGFNLNMVKAKLLGDTLNAGSKLDDSLRLIEETAEYIRHVTTDLRPPLLDDYGLLTALRDYAEQFTARTGIEVVIQGEEPALRPSLQIETCLFRMAQEAFTNVAKHAEASRLVVMVDRSADKIRIIIEDNGKGFDLKRSIEREDSHGWGLITMPERVEAMGGIFRMESAPGCGTRIIAEISL